MKNFLNLEPYENKMQKRMTKIAIGSMFALASILSLFSGYMKIDFLFNNIFIGILMVALGGFIAYICYESENKVMRYYLIALTVLLAAMGIVLLLPSFKVSSDYLIVVTVPSLIGKIVLLFGSGFTLIDSYWK